MYLELLTEEERESLLNAMFLIIGGPVKVTEPIDYSPEYLSALEILTDIYRAEQ